MATTLYPPIIKTSMPVYPKESSSIKIYFSLSSFNAASSIKQVHVVVRDRDTNRNLLNTTKWPAEIKPCSLQEVDPSKEPERAATEERFYITLEKTDLQGGFNSKRLYKIQLRFSAQAINLTQTSAPKLSDFTSLSDYSEWSTVCLIKFAAAPKIKILEFYGYSAADDDFEASDIVYASTNCQFNLAYNAGADLEVLQYWRMRLYNDTHTILLSDSGQKTFNSYDYNAIENNVVVCECFLPYQLTNQSSYILNVQTESRNGYILEQEYSFTASAIIGQQLNAKISFSIIEDDGYAKILVTGTEENISANITLQRTSSKSGFSIWEDIANTTVTNTNLNWEFDDFTIESGVFYQYAAQTRDNFGRRGPRVLSSRQMGEFEDAFLVETGGSLDLAKQLKLKYDFNISNAAVSIGESKVDTIGSKYPFVRRNGNMYYRTFQCSGLITAFMDKGSNLFTTDKILYSNYQNLYNNLRLITDNQVNSYDYTHEKEFRKAVIDFLYNDKVKLFKSLQEGNLLVKVMNVSLTPRASLGRLLYDFSATLIEVDEASIENFDKYNIQNVGTYQTRIDFGEVKLGQLNSHLAPFPAGTDFIDLIRKKYHYKETIDGVKVQDFYLPYFKIEFESPPYLIDKNTLAPINDTNSNTTFNSEDVVLGWVINIKSQDILISPPNNIYEIKGENVRFSASEKITIPKETSATVDFLISLSQNVDDSRTPISYVYKNILGQIRDSFISSENIINRIWYKYYIDLYGISANITGIDKYYVKLRTVDSINIDADPGAVVYVKSSATDELTRFVINETGELFLDPGLASASITDLYLAGFEIDTRYIYPTYNTEDSKIIFNEKHNKTGTDYTELIEYDFYEEDNQYYIFYKGEIRETTPIATDAEGNIVTMEIDCPVPAFVDYYGQLERGFYGE